MLIVHSQYGTAPALNNQTSLIYELQPREPAPEANLVILSTSRSYRGKPTACKTCSKRKTKCEKNANIAGDPRCVRCVKLNIPQHICTSETVTQLQPFQKWSDKVYEDLLVGVCSDWIGEARTAQLRHYSKGPTFKVTSRQFTPNSGHQVHVSKMNSSGWHTVQTTAYAISVKVEIASYVNDCVDYAIAEAGTEAGLSAGFLNIATYFRDNTLIEDCLEMYTALRLIRIGCQFDGEETLGMVVVDDSQSAWYKHTPVPRMVQNQLCHQLEMRMVELDAKILKRVEVIMRAGKRSEWLIMTIAVFLLLHIRELDAGRNIHWRRYKDPLGFWIHPSGPAALIELSMASCNSLLSTYHASTCAPLSMNWDLKKNQDLVDNDERQITAMKALQSYVQYLNDHRMIGRDPVTTYEVGNPGSIALTISTLMFVSKENARAPNLY